MQLSLSKIKFAQAISFAGHPLLTIPLIISAYFLAVVKTTDGMLASALTIVVIIIPVAVNMLRKSRSGVYTNFDVSNQKQRQSWYWYVSLLLLVVTLVLFFTVKSYQLRHGFLLAGLLLVTAQILNRFIKSSLHVSLSVFLAFLLLNVSVWLWACLLFFAVLISWSRLALERHTGAEVVVGWILGLIYGTLLWWFTG